MNGFHSEGWFIELPQNQRRKNLCSSIIKLEGKKTGETQRHVKTESAREEQHLDEYLMSN